MDNDSLDDDKVKRLREHWDEDVEGEPLSRREALQLWSWVIGAAALAGTALYAWFS